MTLLLTRTKNEAICPSPAGPPTKSQMILVFSLSDRGIAVALFDAYHPFDSLPDKPSNLNLT
jgi:hypothetical protein